MGIRTIPDKKPGTGRNLPGKKFAHENFFRGIDNKNELFFGRRINLCEYFLRCLKKWKKFELWSPPKIGVEKYQDHGKI